MDRPCEGNLGAPCLRHGQGGDDVIERDPAFVLAEQLRQTEAQLERLLASGWRQARGEAASLRADAEALAEAGLCEVAARVAAVADAQDAAGALQSIAPAVSACRLLRVRLDAADVPAGWLPLAAPKRKSRAEPDRLLPIARVRLADHREVWACAWLGKYRWLLLEPPFPEAVADEDVLPPLTTPGIFGRLRRQLGQALGGDAPAGSFWLRRRLAGSVRWLARYPLGAEREVVYCALDDAAWEAEDASDVLLRALHESALADTLTDGRPMLAAGSSFIVKQLQRSDLASCLWLDPSAMEALAQAPDEPLWAIIWTEPGAWVPIARIVPGGAGRPARLVHLIPGAPEAILASPA